MNIHPLAIPDVLLIEPKVFNDSRGYFFESYHQNKFASVGIPDHFMQDNISGSRRGVLRGLHYQIRQPRGKLIRVLKGEIFDVVVDVRREIRHVILGFPPGCDIEHTGLNPHFKISYMLAKVREMKSLESVHIFMLHSLKCLSSGFYCT